MAPAIAYLTDLNGIPLNLDDTWLREINSFKQ